MYFGSSISLFIDLINVNRTGNRNHLHMQKRDSKSFDSGALYRPEMDDDSNGTSSMERIERIERADRSDSKIMLPTPPVRKSPATAPAAAAATAQASVVAPVGLLTANQSEDHSNTNTDSTGNDLSDSNKHESELKSNDPMTEVRKMNKTLSFPPPKKNKHINDNCDNRVGFFLLIPFILFIQ